MDWTDPAFLREAHAWIRAWVVVDGPIEQTHVQPWSTVLRIPTPDGVVWWKATDAISAFEPKLTAVLAGIRPDVVPEVLAIEPDRGWFLMRDAGVRLRERPDRLADWEAVLPAYAELQLAAAARAGEFLSIGVPDERLAGLADRIEALLRRDEFLLLDGPEGMTSAERDALLALVPQIAAQCAALASFGVPETIQHDDLNDGNVFVRDGHNRVMDWGDTCITHPFHSLTVLLRATAYSLRLPPAAPELLRLRDVYLEPFESLGTRRELIEMADLAYRTGTLARAHAWYRYTVVRPPDERGEDVESVPYGLKKYLENGPIGGWE
jgi:hypothetical protein